MKRLWPFLTLLALLFALGLANSRYLTHFAQGLNHTLLQAQTLAQAGEWEQALELAQQAQDRWVSHGVYLHTTLRHADIDAVHLLFLQDLAFLQARDESEYRSVNAALMGHLELLWEQELFTIQNIL